ncbi:hypothetical protein LVW35_05390 [Pseudomonas sp. HN11]|uniref:hypothetical protein n=1 Tax=Pseudomonas sp. HN11 TaxID=1344094 RepID=UPI001F209214|nr:hypothetical protein [Pseudomonas sp. HN11]UII72613.1 hypothetical protein LVW35_05390 [Pseudomonas sp. HN11]
MCAAVASLRQSHVDRLQDLFLSRPSLPVVALQCAQDYLDHYLLAWNLSARLIYLATPTAGDYRYQSLTELLVQRVAQARPMALVEGYHVVMRRVREVYALSGPSLEELERLINQCGARLLEAYAQRLQAWWREPVNGFGSRWAALSDGLLALLYDSPPPPGMAPGDIAQWFPKHVLPPRRPDPHWRLHGAVRVHTVHLRSVGQSDQQALTAPLLILTPPPIRGREQQIVFRPASGIHELQHLEDVGPWLHACDANQDRWFALEVQGDPFDTLAASYLACQLRDLDAIDRTVERTPEQVLGLLDYITDPRRWFADRLSPQQQQLREALPRWLLHASVDDSLAYARLLHSLVQVREQQGAAHFMDGIATLRQFAVQTLQACLAREPRAKALEPGDIRITFDRVIAAAVPVQGGFIAGEVDPVTVTLPELALENLAGFPHTAKVIKVKGAAAPGWLTYDLLKVCIREANVGQAYPALLKKNLIDDAGQASRRRQLFCRAWRVQLPMLALSLKIQGQQGLTSEGYQRIHLAVQATPAERESMALWPLAFKASVDAEPDVIEGFFIIGPQHDVGGPHVLYQPLFEPMLREYPSLDGLFDAIKAPGELQDSVLAWIAPSRQAVYAQGGFHEPHIRHFLPSDEFTVYTKPAPAQLAKLLFGGDPADHVFGAVANALVSLADRQAVSNAEQRWACLKQVGWLLLGTVLPYFPAPLALGGWLLQLTDSVQHDVENLAGEDTQARSAALLDLLVNLMAVLAHQAAPQNPLHSLALEHPVFAPLAKVPPTTRTPQRIPAPVAYTAPGGWANARDVMTPDLQARINPLSVMTYSEPWPTALPNAERTGPWQGLLRDTDPAEPQWQALVRGQLFRVRVGQDRVRVISADGRMLGPWLKPSGAGQWDFDLGLRLRGGSADHIGTATDQENRLKPLEDAHTQAISLRMRASRAMELARSLTRKPPGAISEQQRSQAWDSYVREMGNKVKHSQEELLALKRLRAFKPRPHYEEDLSEVLETIILTAQLLDTQMRAQMVAINLRIRPLLDSLSHEDADEAGADINRQAHDQLRQGMRELATVHDQAIHWRALEERYLEELTQVPKLGRDRARALTDGLHARPSVLDLQALQLTTLWGISIDVDGQPLDDEFFAGMSDTINRARWASRSLAEMDQLRSDTAERIELLESVDHVLSLTDDQIEFWRTMEPNKFDLVYLQKLQELLGQLHQRTERQLSGLVQPTAEAEPAYGPPASARDSGPRRRKIIRTRNRDLFVARMSPPSEHQQREIAEVGDASAGPVGSFTQAEDGVWDLTQPETPRPDPALGSLMSKARQLLGEVDRAIASVDAMVARANDPASLQELLEAQARSREWLADDIQRKLQGAGDVRLAAVQQANARALEGQLRAAVLRLQAAGLAARIRATRNRTMTANDVAFLHGQGEVRIVRQGGRVALRGAPGDFLQVYAVLNVHDDKPLCFAHFHYPRTQGPDDHYTAGHLKTPEQERKGRQAQAQVEADAFARMRLGQTGRAQQTLEIHRATIELRQARRLFFSVD